MLLCRQRRILPAYHTNSFSLADQQGLARIAHQLSVESHVPVLISNHDTELTRDWYQHASLHVVKARRTISRNILRPQ
ncbi:DNA adenine methylase [Serratia fonticola]|uniref:DNA adenine methylase n=1 Tax=Serratia fonticola TaxID=47917 RepID=A0A4U9WRB0_SERFO|nr:DNA adenine methylase [Serratia fonticola]